MEILKKLLLLVCFVTVSATFAMNKNKYNILTVKDSEEESSSSDKELPFQHDNIETIKNDCLEVMKKQKILYYNNYFSNNKRYKNRNITVIDIKFFDVFPQEKREPLSKALIVGENLSSTQCREMREKILAFEYDTLTCSDGKTRYGMLVDQILSALSPRNEKIGQNINQKAQKFPTNREVPVTPEKNLSGWQRFTRFIFNYQYVAGMATTFGLLKLYSWFWPNKNQ